MNFTFHAPVHFEDWDFRSPDDPGIGGSETAVVELARRLALRGHSVTVHAPLRPGCPPQDPGGARWLPLEAVDFSSPGVWALSRCPSALDHFPESHPSQQTWLVCQDVWYPPKLSDGLTQERSAKLDRCLPLCLSQAKWMLEKSPELAGKMFTSSNGIKTDLIGSLDPPPRDPLRLLYTSSPDRGLVPLLKIFKRAREFEPGLTLRAAYGWDNILKCKGKHWVNVRKECESLMKQPGVTWLGRLGQEALYREFLAAGLWVYPTNFTETSCISCMEAQALGAVPITNPLWALSDNVRHGTFLLGDPAGEPLVRAQYVGEILRLARDQELQEKIRKGMMPWARDRFDWERVVDQYEAMARESHE